MDREGGEGCGAMRDISYVRDCPFCAIVAGEDASPEIVSRADDWVAFFPLDPATPGHTLVVPRRHAPDLWDLDARLAGKLVAAVIDVGRAIQSALEPDGMNLITSAGSAAEQTVFHLHLHVVPRWRDDGFGSIWPIEGKRYENERLVDAADRIRAALVEGA